MRILKRLFTALFVSMLACWAIIAVARTIYNFSKLPVDEKQFFNTSEDKKRELTYGESYLFCKFAKINTKEQSRILFLSSGAKTFYLCRYLLYPRQLFIARSNKEVDILLSRDKYDNLLIFKSSDSLLNENLFSYINVQKHKLLKVYPSTKYSKGGLYKI